MSNIKEALDRVFSVYVRVSRADHAGYVECYTCGERLPWKSVDCGHFIKRGNTSVRFDEENCRPQCFNCNRIKDGMAEAFEERLREDLGEEAVDDLIRRGRENSHFTEEWYREKLTFYKLKLKKFGVMM